MAAKLRAPVGHPLHLDAELLERGAELLAVVPRSRRGSPPGVRAGIRSAAPGLALTVSRIFLASSIAIVGAGAPTLNARQANRNAPTASSEQQHEGDQEAEPQAADRASSSPRPSVPRPITTAKIPNTAPAATAAAPRAIFDTFS